MMVNSSSLGSDSSHESNGEMVSMPDASTDSYTSGKRSRSTLVIRARNPWV